MYYCHSYVYLFLLFSQSRSHHAAVVMPSNDIVLVGGNDNDDWPNNWEIFNFNSKTLECWFEIPYIRVWKSPQEEKNTTYKIALTALALPIGGPFLSQLVVKDGTGGGTMPMANCLQYPDIGGRGSMAPWSGGRSELISHFNSIPVTVSGKITGKIVHRCFLNIGGTTRAPRSNPHLPGISRCGSKIVLLDIVCLLKQGLLVVGGVNSDGELLSSTEVYFHRPKTRVFDRAWTRKAGLPRHWSWYIDNYDGNHMIAAQSPKFIEACSTHNLQYLKGLHKHFDGGYGRGQFLLWKTLSLCFLNKYK